MSYQQDLAKMHKERMARLWPEQKLDNTIQKLAEKAHVLKAEISMLESKRDRLKEMIKLMGNMQAETRGEERLIKLRERVCQDHEIPVAMFVGPGHNDLLVIARRQFTQEARMIGASYQRIGYHIGGRDHSTVLNYVKPKRLRPSTAPDAEPMVG